MRLKETISQIEDKFKVDDMYILSDNSKNLCPHVNGLTSICFSEFGKPTKRQSEALLASRIYDPSKSLFYTEIDQNGEVINSNINSCKNAIAGLSLYTGGIVDIPEKIIEAMKQTPMYNQDTKLFSRQYNPQPREFNSNVITQSNLWAIILLSKLDKKEESKEMLESLKKEKLNSESGLYISQDCRNQDHEVKVFCDDQALAGLTYSELGMVSEASEITERMLNSSLYDQSTGLFNSSTIDENKSSYKNGLCGILLGRMGFNKELRKLQDGLITHLYNPHDRLFNQSTKDTTKFPDSSALAMAALNYDELRHNIF